MLGARPMKRRRPSLAWLVLLSACEGTAGSSSPGGTSDDLPAFAAQAQPVLAKDCAFPACHGAEHRGLRLWAVGRSRLEGSATLNDVQFAALTPEELGQNLDATLAFVDPAHPDESELLERALPKTAGGRGHRGGALFLDREDPDYEQLLTWIETAVRP